MQPHPPGTPPPSWYAAPPPGMPGGPAGRPDVRPSGWWYGVAALIGVAGVVVATVVVVAAVVDVADRVDAFDRAIMPATLEVEISEPGGYTVYHEYEGAFGDDAFARRPDVDVTDPSGDGVVLRSYDTSVTYDFRGHDGEAVYSFEAAEAGTYVVEASMPGLDSGEHHIAVGRGLGDRLILGILGGALIALVALIGTVVLAVVVGVRRGRSRRAQSAPPGPAGWAPPGSWGGPPPPGWGPPPAWGSPAPGSSPPGWGSPAPGSSPPGWGPPAPGSSPPGWGPPAPGSSPPGWGPPPPGWGPRARGSGRPDEGAPGPQDAPYRSDGPADPTGPG